MRVAERSRFETSVRVRTIGMKVPRSPTAPESSEERGFLRRRRRRSHPHRSWRRGVVVVSMIGSLLLCVVLSKLFFFFLNNWEWSLSPEKLDKRRLFRQSTSPCYRRASSIKYQPFNIYYDLHLWSFSVFKIALRPLHLDSTDVVQTKHLKLLAFPGYALPAQYLE